MIKRFVIGDIHGRFEALKEVLKKSNFNYDEDWLILLGDICDGGYNTYEVVEELLKIKNRIFIIGNHDVWFMNHIKSGWAQDIWLKQGGNNTLQSYNRDFDINIPVTHQHFFNTGVGWVVLKTNEDDKGMLFVHGGFEPKWDIEAHPLEYLTWDRTIIDKFKSGVKTKYKKVFIGHTSTQHIGSSYNEEQTEPICIHSPTTDLWCVDTGAGWNGKLTIMNIDTEEYWQSEIQKPSQ